MREKVDFLRKFFISIVCFFICTSSICSADIQIKFGYSDVEAFPFQINHEAQPPGIALEIITRVAKDIGISIIFLQLPNKRVLHSLQKGEIDGAFMYSYKPERESDGHFPMKNGKPDEKKRIATLSYYMYKLKDCPLQWDGEKLSCPDFNVINNKIGANTGYSIVDDLKNKGIEVDDGARTTDQNFKKLLNKRIIGYAHQNLVADNYIKHNNITAIEKLPIPIVTKSYYLLFSHQFMKKNPQLAEKIWNHIAEVRESVTKDVAPKYSE